jgi:hypothetical protein
MEFIFPEEVALYSRLFVVWMWSAIHDGIFLLYLFLSTH